MNYLNKILIAFLILTSLHLCITKITLAGDATLLASSGITKNAPESVSTPEINIPAEKGTESGTSGKGWLWVVIAVLAVAGGVALAGSGGGSSNNSDGTLNVTWGQLKGDGSLYFFHPVTNDDVIGCERSSMLISVNPASFNHFV